MSNLSQRLSKLEPKTEHKEYLAEAGQRVLSYFVETRHLFKCGKLPAFVWDDAQEKMYQDWKKNDPEFEAQERKILADLGLMEGKPYAR